MTDQRIIETVQKLREFVEKEVSLAVKKQEYDRQSVIEHSNSILSKLQSSLISIDIKIKSIEDVLADLFGKKSLKERLLGPAEIDIKKEIKDKYDEKVQEYNKKLDEQIKKQQEEQKKQQEQTVQTEQKEEKREGEEK